MGAPEETTERDFQNLKLIQLSRKTTTCLVNMFEHLKPQQEEGQGLSYQELGVICGLLSSSACKQVSIRTQSLPRPSQCSADRVLYKQLISTL